MYYTNIVSTKYDVSAINTQYLFERNKKDPEPGGVGGGSFKWDPWQLDLVRILCSLSASQPPASQPASQPARQPASQQVIFHSKLKT